MDLVLTDEAVPNAHSVEVENAIAEISEGTDGQQLVTVSGFPIAPADVLVTSSAGSLFVDQDISKTTRIIIQNPTVEVLKNGHQTITFNPLNRSLSVPEKNINWDSSVYDQVLSVRCRNVRGDLHKNKFGSGNKGRCIQVNDAWHTPSEFEALCGRGSSKDWKRSIRYGGRTLMCLIDQGILRPHAATCTCNACCDDTAIGDGSPEVSSGPIRLFTPYKRRKRPYQPKLKVSTNVRIAPNDNIVSAPVEMQTEEVLMNGISDDCIATLTVPLVNRDTSTVICSDSVIVTPETKTQAPKSNSNSIDFNEQKQWWQLEEMVKNMVRQTLDLQKHVETVKTQCTLSKEKALHELRTQLENERKEVLHSCRLEAQVALSKAICQAKTEKEAAIQDALEQSRLEMEEKLNSMVNDKVDSSKRCANCDREAFSECTGCRRVSYCSAFCQRKDWISHKDECSDLLDSDCDLVESCDGSNS